MTSMTCITRNPSSRLAVSLALLLTGIALGGCGGGDKPDSAGASARETTEAHGKEEKAGHDEGHAEGASADRVTLSEAAMQTAGVRVEVVRAEMDGGIGEDLLVPGQVEFEPNRVAIISPRVSGRIERLLVVVGDRVSAGQPVALVFSPAYVTAQNDLLQSVRRARTLTGTQDEAGARAIADAARRRLALMGVAGSEIARLEASGTPRNELVIPAPFSGSIMQAEAMAGQAVEPGQKIFQIADLSVVDVVAAIPERALPLVFRGQKALIGLAAFPQMQLAGTVERIRDELSPETRSVGAVIHAVNPAGRLRPGMFATVRLEVRVSTLTRDVGAAAERAAPLLTIPEAAVVSDGDKRYAFVEVGPRSYERRELDVVSLAPAGSAAPTTNRIGVRAGLKAGDRVVTNGAFVLKSELAKAGLGDHDH